MQLILFKYEMRVLKLLYFLLFLLLLIACSKKDNFPDSGSENCLISEISELKSNVNENHKFYFEGNQLVKMEVHIETLYLKFFYYKFFYRDKEIYKITDYVDRSLSQNTDMPDSIETMVTYDKNADTLVYESTEYLYGNINRRYATQKFILSKDRIIREAGGVFVYYTLDGRGNILFKSSTLNPSEDPYNYSFKFDDRPSPFKNFPVQFKLVFIDLIMNWGWTNNITEFQYKFKFDPTVSGKNVWQYNSYGFPKKSDYWEFSYANCK
jgi:hypothetical protein